MSGWLHLSALAVPEKEFGIGIIRQTYFLGLAYQPGFFLQKSQTSTQGTHKLFETGVQRKDLPPNCTYVRRNKAGGRRKGRDAAVVILEVVALAREQARDGSVIVRGGDGRLFAGG